MKWYRLYKESDASVDIKKLLKLNGVTKLPAGTKFSGTKASWEKHKGHAGSNTIHKMCIQLEQAGWKKGDWTTGGIPDGSSVANRQTYTSPDGRILMSYTEYYGCTSYDNSFYITFKLAESPVNESDDWVGDDGGVNDDINPKFADLRDAFDKIDDRGFQWSSGKWRIRPDELGYDWKIYYDGEGWIGTVNYKTREYDVWNTKVVEKHEFKDFLHALNADGFKSINTVCESTIKGTGRVDFDDDLVAVYNPDGKLEYKGLFDDCPYKDDDMRYDKTTMTYRIEGPNGDYRTMAKLAESNMNESDDDWNNGTPQVLQYIDGEEIQSSVEDFMSHVNDVERTVEDIFIQNSEVYENAKDPWRMFIDDMCDGHVPETAFDLSYYLNKAAKEQLPDDINKHLHLGGSTYEFDATSWLYDIFERLMPICKDTVDESTIRGASRVGRRLNGHRQSD